MSTDVSEMRAASIVRSMMVLKNGAVRKIFVEISVVSFEVLL
jgi:hypothetical protein